MVAVYALVGGFSMALALLVTPVVTRLAVLWGVVDEPDERRIHEGRVPRLGGVGIFFSFLLPVVSVAIFGPSLSHLLDAHAGWTWLFLGTCVVLVCGLLDDVFSLGPLPKLGCQLLAALAVVLGGQGITAVTNPFDGETVSLGLWSAPVTVLWVLGITNAFNLIDGLDGLAAGVGMIASATLFAIALENGQPEVALLSLALAGALAGFLWYNFNPASVFLGDTGSLLVGYLLSVLSIRGASKGATTFVVLVPLLALGFPIADTVLAVLRRSLRVLRVVRSDPERNEYRFFVVGSASIFRADRDHIHHRLLSLGLDHRRAVVLLYGLCVVLSGLAFLAVHARGPDTAILVGAVGVAMYLGIRKLGYEEIRLLERGVLLPLFDLPVLHRRVLKAMADAVFLAAACVAALQLPLERPFTETRLVGLVGLVVGLKMAVFLQAGVYFRAYRHAAAEDFLALFKALVFAEAAALAGVVLFRGPVAYPVTRLLCDFYLSATLVLGSRFSFTLLELIARRGKAKKAVPVLIYGAGNRGRMLLEELRNNPSLGYRVAGFLDDRESLRGSMVYGIPVLGGLAELGRWIDSTGAREVIVARTELDPAAWFRAAATCRERNVLLRKFRVTFEGHSADAEPAEPSAPALVFEPLPAAEVEGSAT